LTHILRCQARARITRHGWCGSHRTDRRRQGLGRPGRGPGPGWPEPPSTVNGRHQRQPVNLKLARRPGELVRCGWCHVVRGRPRWGLWPL